MQWKRPSSRRTVAACNPTLARGIGAWAVALTVGLFLACGAAAHGQTDEKGYNPRACVGLYAWVQDRAKKGTTLWDDLDAVLGEVRAAGFRAVEGFLRDFFGSDERAERTRQLVTKHKIILAGLYSGGKLYEEQAGRKAVASILEQARRAKAYPSLFIDVNPDPLPRGAKKTDEQLATQVRLLNDLGRQLAEMGMQLVIHQHAPEIRHGAREHRYNIRHVDPSVVGFCIDTDWFKRGGEDPLTLTRETGRKIKAVHLRNGKDGVWMETFGPGDIDYEAIAKYLREIEFKGWLSLELAVEKRTRITRGIVENHRLGRAYLESVFLDKPGSGRSRWGGWKGQRTTPIGYFYVDQIDGKWWLIDPDGWAFFCKGVCSVHHVADHCPALGGHSPYERVTKQKYGTPEKFAAAAVKRLWGWNFNTLGAYSISQTWRQGMPYSVILRVGGAEGASWLRGDFPDFFSDSFRRRAEARAMRTCTQLAGDPYLVGYFTDAEPWWGVDPRGMKTMLEAYLALASGSPGKKVAVDFLLGKYKNVASLDKAWGSSFVDRDSLLANARPPALNDVAKRDASEFLRIVVEQYAKICYETIRKYDPYHLVMGCRLLGPVPPEIQRALKLMGALNVLKSYAGVTDEIDQFWFKQGGMQNLLRGFRGYVDVLSINYYAQIPDPDHLRLAYELSGAPVMTSEFGFKAMDSGLPNNKGAGLPVATQKDRAEHFTKYVQSVADLPFGIGYQWFEHADQPAQGRFDGENCNYGLVNIRDEPWELLVTRMTQVNSTLEARHAGRRQD